MVKVLIATDKPFAPVAVKGIREIVEEQGYELVLLEKYTSPQELIAAVADVDAMIVRSDKVTREVIEAAKKLKIVVRAGAGYDNIDLVACTSRDVVVMNTPGQNANAVAELAFGLMVYMARNFYNGKSGSELKGKKIGVHAYGNVGQNVGRIARGFGMEVYAFDPYMTDEQIKLAGAIPLHSVEELYATCHYVSLHIPATPDTKKSINRDLLQRMPTGAVLVNTARKEVIDEEGLARLMEERPDFSYITDVAPDSDLFKKFEGRYYATPKKMGAQTEEANVNAGLAAARQIVNFIKKGDKRFQVN
ncbi:MAG: 3-phosphoglycerate dehydrogenase [Odoribacteraceae bacterium]|jgi:D-3-phosphoglycerate dehydrogenase|nr:3-phosphoglycerate dehydrogenase [Odoribacteraceae bacterium]